MQRIIAFFMTILMFLFPRLNVPKTEFDKETWTTDYTYVFVHGLSGWGDYSPVNTVMPYWGMFGGNLMKYLNARGVKAVAATVAGADSAWDRACELYAQLTGTKVDYGKEHSERCHHPRFGKDYSRCPLIDEFSAEAKINLLGHSFGGATVLTFLELMANGSNAETAKQRFVALKPRSRAVYFEPTEEMTRKYPKGTMIFCENQSGADMFIIQSGEVSISKVVDGNEVTLAVLRKGDMFGEMALLENKPRSASAIAHEECVLMVVNRKNFDMMVATQAQLIARLTTTLAERLWAQHRQLTNSQIK